MTTRLSSKALLRTQSVRGFRADYTAWGARSILRQQQGVQQTPAAAGSCERQPRNTCAGGSAERPPVQISEDIASGSPPPASPCPHARNVRPAADGAERAAQLPAARGRAAGRQLLRAGHPQRRQRRPVQRDAAAPRAVPQDGVLGTRLVRCDTHCWLGQQPYRPLMGTWTVEFLPGSVQCWFTLEPCYAWRVVCVTPCVSPPDRSATVSCHGVAASVDDQSRTISLFPSPRRDRRCTVGLCVSKKNTVTCHGAVRHGEGAMQASRCRDRNVSARGHRRFD